jgi:hypothetical protein
MNANVTSIFYILFTSKTAIYVACLFTVLLQIPSQAATMIAKWDFNDSGNATTSVAGVGGYTGTFSSTGGRTASGQGRTGTTGDFAFAPGSASGAMIANSSPFLSAFNTTMVSQTISITYWQNLTTVSYNPTDPTSFYAVSPTVATSSRGLNAHSPYTNGQAYFDTSGLGTAETRINGFLGATNNTWQLITMIYDNGTKYIYRDSTLIASSAVGISLALKSDITAFHVGNSNTGNQAFKGLIDDFTIWQGALTLSEINNLVIPESSTTAMIALLALAASIQRKRSSQANS